MVGTSGIAGERTGVTGTQQLGGNDHGHHAAGPLLETAGAALDPGQAQAGREVLEVEEVSRAGELDQRGIGRHPLRTGFAMLGLSLATSILVVSLFTRDTMEELINVTYYLADRQDATLSFVEKRSLNVVNDVGRLPGVLAVEPLREVPIRIRHGTIERRMMISGRPREAIAAYERAAKALPNEPLVRVDLAKAQLAANDPALDRAALAHLKEAVRRDDTNPEGWRQLSIAYGRVGELGESALANAEFFYLVGSLPDLRAAIARAERLLKPGTPSWQRLEDLKTQVAQIREDRRR